MKELEQKYLDVLEELDYVNDSLIQTLFGKTMSEPEETDVKIVTEAKTVQPGVQGNVVAIYDNAGIPSLMYRFERVSDKELFGGSDKPHPAFVIGGEVYDEIYISVYQNCEINGKPYSLPYQKPWTNINNDAALDIDLTLAGDDWTAVLADNGKPVRVSVDEGVMFTTDEAIEQDYTGDCWEDVDVDCISEQLTELGLYAGEPKAYCYMDSTDGEYFPFRGGHWHHGTHAGVFSSYFYRARAHAYGHLGFRSAYYKKKTDNW